MPEFGVWTPQEIADEIGMSRQFVIDIIVGKRKKYSLPAKKISRNWVVATPEAEAFIERYKTPGKDTYTPNDLAKAISKSRKYILDALTGYGGRKVPSLEGVKRGNRWCISREEGERFIGEHGKSSH